MDPAHIYKAGDAIERQRTDPGRDFRPGCRLKACPGKKKQDDRNAQNHLGDAGTHWKQRMPHTLYAASQQEEEIREEQRGCRNTKIRGRETYRLRFVQYDACKRFRKRTYGGHNQQVEKD